MTLGRRLPLLALVLLMIVPVMAQDVLTRVRDLYMSAEYDAALRLLDEADDTLVASERETALEYRALCFLANDRQEGVEEAIRRIVQADPFYRPIAGRFPTRYIAAVERVRGMMLPPLIRERYLKAVTDLKEERYTESAAGFEIVWRLVNDLPAELHAEGRGSELAEIAGKAKQLQVDPVPSGSLMEQIARVSELAAIAAEAAEQQRNSSVAHGALSEQITPLPSTPIDDLVVPPIPIREDIPSWQPATRESASIRGVLEVQIDSQGNVETVRLAQPTYAAYDSIILQAATQWKYRPATRQGVAVPYRKTIAITLIPQPQVGETAPQVRQ